MQERIMKLKDIKISKDFKKHPPQGIKMKEKWEHYRKTGNLMEEIIINQDEVLVDGYTSYLIAEADGIKKVKVTKITPEPWLNADKLNIKDYQVCVSKDTRTKQMFDKGIHIKNEMYLKDKIKIFLLLLFIGISASGLGWFIGQIVKLKMEVGG